MAKNKSVLISHYWVVNGDHSEPYELNEWCDDIDAKRAELEKKHNCFRKRFGVKERVAHIDFYLTEPPQKTPESRGQ